MWSWLGSRQKSGKIVQAGKCMQIQEVKKNLACERNMYQTHWCTCQIHLGPHAPLLTPSWWLPYWRPRACPNPHPLPGSGQALAGPASANTVVWGGVWNVKESWLQFHSNFSRACKNGTDSNNLRKLAKPWYVNLTKQNKTKQNNDKKDPLTNHTYEWRYKATL